MIGQNLRQDGGQVRYTSKPSEVKQAQERATSAGLDWRDFYVPPPGGRSGQQGRMNTTFLNQAIQNVEAQRGIESANAAAQAAAAQAAGARAYADQQISALRATYEEQLNKDRQYTALAEQIRALTGGAGGTGGNTSQYNAAMAALNARRNLGSGDLASALNFQVSDQQILADINNARATRLREAVDAGQGRIAFLTDRIASANNLLSGLPDGDPRQKSSQEFVKQLQNELNDVTKSVVSAQKQITDFVPSTLESEDGQKIVSDFRQSIRLPEERAQDQIRQIDPQTLRTARGLGREYGRMANEPLPDTTDPRTEELRGAIEDEALNQLRLGSTLDQEVRRNVEQGVRAAQTARGNIFGVGPATEEAMQTGLAGEQRKLARYGLGLQFLGSGQTRGDALAANLAFRDAVLSNRLGAASNFIAGGPSVYNLANARTQQQQAAFANYINANQANPGQFNPAIYSTPGYMYADPSAPVNMAGQQAGMFSNLYGQQAGFASDIYRTQSNYLAQTYGDQTRAIASSYTSPSQAFGNIASGLGSMFSFSGALPFCWVAREVYGEDNPRWLMFRDWMLNEASDNLRSYYIKHGEKIAESIRNKPRIKAIIRKWMDSKISGWIRK